MKDPEFVAALEEMEPEFQAAREVLRLAQGMPQKESSVLTEKTQNRPRQAEMKRF
jgi:hypothetical protein